MSGSDNVAIPASASRSYLRYRWEAHRSCGAVSAEGAVDGDLVQGALKNRELLVVKSGDEQLEIPRAWTGAVSLRRARPASVRATTTPRAVRVGAGSTNEALIDQPGDATGHARP